MGGVVLLVILMRLLPALWPGSFNLFERLEWITFDLRAQRSFDPATPAAAGLGAVFIDDASLETVSQNYGYSWPWPRQLYGRLVQELTAEGARAIALDILFLEPRNDGGDPQSDGQRVSSDQLFADQMRESGHVVLAAAIERTADQAKVLLPYPLFRTNAWQVAHIASDVDSDAVLRRVKAFYTDPRQGRIWHMGLVLAAADLGLDLSKATVEEDRIILRGAAGVERTIPTDSEGYFYVDWSIPCNDRRIKQDSFVTLLQQDIARSNGKTNIPRAWEDKIVVVGSIGTGNNVQDVGATPLSARTYLVSKHWNVANSVITNRFIHRSSALTEVGLIAFLSAVSGLLTLRFRTLLASFLIVAVMVEYFTLGAVLYDKYRYWLPLVLPGVFALLLTHVCLITYRVVVEQRERFRVKTIFSKVVAPDVVNELLKAEKVSVSGARRKVTVFFADVRGFTQVTDEIQARADAHVRASNLSPTEAEAYQDEQAREILATVNLYLGVVADMVKHHGGTLDKYIGDSVMAFWGAPASSDRQAADCVSAAIDAQKSIHSLNLRRAAENEQRAKESEKRKAAGQPPLPRLTLLALGTGINTGTATVGLMGSDAHIVNYTVFGREVNLASRLEGISGRGRIIISRSTFLELQRTAPLLATRCIELPAQTVKGFRDALTNYEVRWRDGESIDAEVYDTEFLSGTMPPASQV